jgi:hypothetical protein
MYRKRYQMLSFLFLHETNRCFITGVPQEIKGWGAAENNFLW